MELEMKTQKCGGCRTMRTPSSFIYKQKKNKTCGVCWDNRKKNKEKGKESCKKWREANKEKTKEYYNDYREANKERISEKNKEWREANKEKTKEYRVANKEIINEKAKEYRVANVDKIVEYKKGYCDRMRQEQPLLYKLRKMVNSSRTADKIKDRYNETEYVDMEYLFKIMEIQEGKCVYCDVDMVVDDFNQSSNNISIQRIDNSLGHNKLNCVFCCFKCNVSKKEAGIPASFYQHILDEL